MTMLCLQCQASNVMSLPRLTPGAMSIITVAHAATAEVACKSLCMPSMAGSADGVAPDQH